MNKKEKNEVLKQTKELITLCEESVSRCKNNPQLFDDNDLEIRLKQLKLTKEMYESMLNNK